VFKKKNPVISGLNWYDYIVHLINCNGERVKKIAQKGKGAHGFCTNFLFFLEISISTPSTYNDWLEILFQGSLYGLVAR